jgi:type II secretory pathway pseudopilin PulG
MNCRSNAFPASGAAAFTLIEIALAMGIASFALVGILGIIPLAVETARKARCETRATFIALTVLETLRSGNSGEGIIQIDPDPASSPAFESVYLPPATGTLHRDLAYDGEGAFLGRMVAYNYATGEETLQGTVFIARLTLNADNGLIRTEVSVETPAIAPESNRTKYSYMTLITP